MTVDLPVQSGVLSNTWKLLKLRWRISFNSFKRSRLIVKLLAVIAVLAWIAFVGIMFVVSWKLVSAIRSPSLQTYFPEVDIFVNLINLFPVIAMVMAFFGVLLTSFGGLLQTLYLAGDMDFLLSAPVPMRSVFASKLLQTILPNLALLASLGLPILFGLGVAGSYNFLYYLFLPIVLVAVTLSAAGIAGLLVITVARIFPARRVAEVLGFFVAIFSMLCSQAGNFMRFGETEFSEAQFSGSLQLATQFNTLWFPLTWAGRGLVALGEGRWLPGFILLTLTLTLSGGLFWFVLALAERMYYTGWANMQVVAGNRKRRNHRAGKMTATQQTATGVQALLVYLIPSQVRAIVWKDFIVLRRDLRHLSQIITPLIFGVLYAFMFLRPDRQSSPDIGQEASQFFEGLKPAMTYLNVGFSILVGWMLMNRLASMSFSSEGKDFWMLKAAPVSAGRMMAGKFLVAYIPTLVLSCIYLVVISIIQGSSLMVLFYSLAIIIFCLAGMDGLLLSFGAIGANFTWEDPRKMSSGTWGCLGMILAPLFVILALGLFIGPVIVTMMFNIAVYYGYLIGLVLGGGISVLCAAVPVLVSLKRVEKLGEV